LALWQNAPAALGRWRSSRQPTAILLANFHGGREAYGATAVIRGRKDKLAEMGETCVQSI
jgi:hypothetical protein